MAKVRVYELAKEFGVEAKAVMDEMKEMGEFVRSASSTVDAPVVRRLKERFSHTNLSADIRSAIIERRFGYVEQKLGELRSTDQGKWDSLRREIGELIAQRHLRGGAGGQRVEWLTGLWAMSDDAFGRKYLESVARDSLPGTLNGSGDGPQSAAPLPSLASPGPLRRGGAGPGPAHPSSRRPEALAVNLKTDSSASSAPSSHCPTGSVSISVSRPAALSLAMTSSSTLLTPRQGRCDVMSSVRTTLAR